MTTPTNRRALIMACSWLAGLCLACGASGEEDGEAPPSEQAQRAPTQPADPLQAHAATLEHLGQQLVGLASTQPRAFQNPAYPEQPLSPGAVRAAGPPRRVQLDLYFAPPPGASGRSARAAVARTPDGGVRVLDLEGNERTVDGRTAWSGPAAIQLLADALRSRLEDPACPVATATSAELTAMFGPARHFMTDRARTVGDRCAATASILRDGGLVISGASVTVGWTQDRVGALGHLSAGIEPRRDLGFARTEYAMAR